MIAMPLTGWAMVSASPLGLPTIVFGAFEWPHIVWLETATDKATLEAQLKQVHATAGLVMLGLIGLHVAAALKHQFVDRDGLLSRMVPFGSAATSKRGSP
jgi:cytochrome b561